MDKIFQIINESSFLILSIIALMFWQNSIFAFSFGSMVGTIIIALIFTAMSVDTFKIVWLKE